MQNICKVRFLFINNSVAIPVVLSLSFATYHYENVDVKHDHTVLSMIIPMCTINTLDGEI